MVVVLEVVGRLGGWSVGWLGGWTVGRLVVGQLDGWRLTLKKID